jgi:hypothetical protein
MNLEPKIFRINLKRQIVKMRNGQKRKSKIDIP